MELEAALPRSCGILAVARVVLSTSAMNRFLGFLSIAAVAGSLQACCSGASDCSSCDDTSAELQSECVVDEDAGTGGAAGGGGAGGASTGGSAGAAGSAGSDGG